MTKLLRRLVKWFYLLIAILLILLAVLVQSGRSFSYLLGDYKHSIEEYLSQKIEAKVTIQKINADWKGLKPGVQLRGVSLQSVAGEPITDISRAMLRLDILKSLKSARLVWSDLSLEKIKLNFQQQEDGFWKVSGLSPTKQTESQVKLDPLIDMLLLSHHMAVKQSQFEFNFINGRKLSLSAPNVLLENKGNFHRLVLQADIENQSRSLFLLLESIGDPRDQKKSKSTAYLELNQFPTSEPLQATMAFLLSGQKSRLTGEGKVSAKIWARSRDDNNGFDLIGNLELQRLLVDVSDWHIVLDQLSTNLTGFWLRDGKWDLGLQSMNAKLASENIQGMNWIASSEGFKQSLQLRLDQIDLEETHQLLERTGLLGNKKLQEVLQALNPRGSLTNIQLRLPYGDAKNWQLAANAKQVSISPWKGIPGLTGIDGYVQLGAKAGYISINSQKNFSMFYEHVYDAPMTYDRVKGQVAWKLEKENNKVYVNSGALNFYQGEEITSGYMLLSTPWYKGTDNVDLYLQVGSNSLNVSRYKKYTPKLLAPKIQEWLDQSIGDKNTGTATNIGFVYRATLNIKEPYARSFQLDMNLDNASLRYHPEWPALTKISGHMLLDNGELFSKIDKAQIFNTNIEHASVELHPKKDHIGSLLRVKADMTGSASDGLRALREGALRHYIGNSMDSWFLNGNIQTQVNLVVPIGTKHMEDDAYQQVNIDINASNFEMRNLNLDLKNLTGQISFNNKKGLASQDLQATLFNRNVSAELHSLLSNNQRVTRVDLNGSVDMQDLAQWTQRPEALFLKGILPYQVIVDLKHNSKVSEDELVNAGVLQSSSDFIKDAFAEIKLTSDLNGVEVQLPEPYGKKSNSTRSFGLNLWLQPNYLQIQSTYDGKVDALFRSQRGEKGRLLNASIALSQEAKFASDDGVHASEFLVSGFLSKFDLDAWKVTKSQYDEYRQKLFPDQSVTTDKPEEIAGLPFKAELTLGRYQIAANEFENLNVQTTRNIDGWVLDLQNPKIHGELIIPHLDSKPLVVNLKQLYVQTSKINNDGDQSKGLKTASIDPRQLPLANINIDEIFIDGESWGKIGFEILPNSQGVLFDNIRGNIRGMELHHHDVNDRGAQLFWQLKGDSNQSRFVGKLTTNNMSDVLRNWKKPEMVESKTAVMFVDMNWPSAPQDFTLLDMTGLVQLQLTEGRFHRDATAGDGLLRLMSILNFDSIARRLRLDFSDLYKTGLAYDEISGKFSFNRGTMKLDEPLVVRSPSSDLQLAGTFNLRDETVDARIVANLPVAGNLTFYTALATGLPAAAGVYLVSKIFKKQVSQVASISYTMSGSWEKPKMKFDRLFESEDSLRKSVKKAEAETESKKEMELEINAVDESSKTGILESNPDVKTQPQ